MEMDPSVLLLLLANLLHHQTNHLDPLLLLSASSSSPSPLLLLLLSLASLLSPASPPPPPESPSATFNSLTLRLPAPLRDSRWRSAYGLSYPVFATLGEQLRPHLLRSASVPALFPPDLALSVALSRLARGLSPRALARAYALSPALVSKITNAVTRMLSTHLYAEYVKVPSAHRLHQTIHAFKEITSLPNICGAIDASPVKLKCPPASHNPDAYLCRYGFPAVLLQVVADHRKIFWDVCIKAPGSIDDASHFRDSHLHSRLNSGEILRDPTVTVQGVQVRPYIVGDWAFPLHPFLMTPHTPDGSGNHFQNAYDAALMRAWAASVEAAIRLLKGRWRILRKLNVGIDHAAQTVVACCVLHNMCQIAGEPEDEMAYMWQEPKETAPPAAHLENEYPSYCVGETLRNAMSRDFNERQQRHSTGGRGR